MKFKSIGIMYYIFIYKETNILIYLKWLIEEMLLTFSVGLIQSKLLIKHHFQIGKFSEIRKLCN